MWHSYFVQGIEWGTQLTVAEMQCRLSVARIRADNSLRGAVFPVALFSPAGRTVFGAAVECRSSMAEASKIEQQLPQLGGDSRLRRRITAATSTLADGGGIICAPPTSTAALGGGGIGRPAANPPPPHCPSSVSASLSLWRSRRGGVLCIKQVEAGMAPLALFAEEQAVRKLFAFFAEAADATAAAAVGAAAAGPAGCIDQHAEGVRRNSAAAPASLGTSALSSCCPDLSGLAVGLPSSSKASPHLLQLYIEHLQVSPLKLSLSFVPAPWHQGEEAAGTSAKQSLGKQPPHPGGSSGGGGSSLVRLLLSLAQLEGAWVQLRGLELRHPLLAPNALARVVASHYVK